MSTNNKKLQAWVDEIAALCQPDNVVWCDGSKEEWENVVSDMIAMGAPLLDDEIDAVAQYLTASFSPAASSSSSSSTSGSTSGQAAANTNPVATFPEGQGKEIIETVCSQCHGLNNISDASRTKEEWESVVSDMVARGAPLLIDEIETVANYLAEHFGP